MAARALSSGISPASRGVGDHHQPDRATATRIANMARAELAAAGEVGPAAEPSAAAHRPPASATRSSRSGTSGLRTTRGHWIANGDRWRITNLEADGRPPSRASTAAAPPSCRPATWPKHAALAYATTVHKAQGMNRRPRITLVTDTMRPPGVTSP